jgi:hypothetical protein
VRVSFTHSGSLSKTEKFLKKMQKLNIAELIDKQAQRGVTALSNATPRDTGRVANSWGYVIEKSKGKVVITWTNSDIENGFPVAIMIQYGHGTGTGGYVSGQDYINPAMRPVFDSIIAEVWKVVTSA